MGWRTIMISRPAELGLKHSQLLVCQDGEEVTLPLEDIGVLMLDTPQTRLSGRLLSACAERKIAAFVCDGKHLPAGVLLPFNSHHRQLKVFRRQLAMSKPLRKRLWQTLVRAKIANQAEVLSRREEPAAARRLDQLARKVRSGDADNLEAQAAAVYFRALFGKDFARRRPLWQNSALNYSYALLRGLIARDLCAAGYQPALGLGHHSEQNAFNLADDLLEPWRPVADTWVLGLIADSQPDIEAEELLPAHKQALVTALGREVALDSERFSVQAAVAEQVASLGRALAQGDAGLVRHAAPVFQAGLFEMEPQDG